MITHFAIYDTDGRRYYPPRSEGYEFPRLRPPSRAARSADADESREVTSVLEPLVDADIADGYVDPDAGLLVHRFRARPSVPGLPSRSQEHFAVFLGVDPRYHPRWTVDEDHGPHPLAAGRAGRLDPAVGTDGGTATGAPGLDGEAATGARDLDGETATGARDPDAGHRAGSVDAGTETSMPLDGAGELLAAVLRRDDWSCRDPSDRDRPTDPANVSLYAAADGESDAAPPERTLRRQVLRTAVERSGGRLTVGVRSYRDAVRLLRFLSETGATVAFGRFDRPDALEGPDVAIRYGVETDAVVAADGATERRLRRVGSDLVSARVDEAFAALDAALSHLPAEEAASPEDIDTCDRLLDGLAEPSTTDPDPASHVEAKAVDAVRTLRAADEYDGPGSDRRRFRSSRTATARSMISDRRAALRELAVDAAAARLEGRLEDEAARLAASTGDRREARREIRRRVGAGRSASSLRLRLSSALLGAAGTVVLLTLALVLLGPDALALP